MEGREGIRVVKNSRIIPLPPVDWGGGDVRDVVLLEITTPEGITGLGSAYAGVNQVRDALTLYKKDPLTLHNADAEMTIAMSAIDIALWDVRGKEENLPVSELLGGRKRDRILAYATVDLPMTSARAGDAFDKILRSVVDQGFRAIKLCIENFGHRNGSKPDKEWDLCEAGLLKFARKIVGKNIQLMSSLSRQYPIVASLLRGFSAQHVRRNTVIACCMQAESIRVQM